MIILTLKVVALPNKHFFKFNWYDMNVLIFQSSPDSEVRKGDSDKQRLQAEIERLQEENKSLKVMLHSYYYIVKFDILYTLE